MCGSLAATPRRRHGGNCDIPTDQIDQEQQEQALENGDNYNDPIMIQDIQEPSGWWNSIGKYTQKYMTHATEFVLELSHAGTLKRCGVTGLNHVSSHCGPSIPKLSTFSY